MHVPRHSREAVARAAVGMEVHRADVEAVESREERMAESVIMNLTVSDVGTGALMTVVIMIITSIIVWLGG